jgi:hypothetical protein
MSTKTKVKYLTKNNYEQHKSFTTEQQIELTKESIKNSENHMKHYSGNPTKLDGLRFKIQTQGLEGTIKKAITVEHPNGDKDEYVSVAQTAIAIKMNYSTLCSLLNGRAKNPTEFKIYKSQVNS